jgi:hypothetical protein
VTGFSWWLVNRAFRLLEADEREVVQGDFAESGSTGGQALRDVVGLIARRHVGAWTDWGPWVGLMGLVAPLGLILSVVSRYWANNSAIYAWFYVNNWTWEYLDSPGARLDLAHTIGNVSFRYLTLMVWSGTAGFALASLSRRAIWVNGSLFCLIVFGGTLGSTTTALLNHGNAAVFSLSFYRVAYPLIVRTVLIVLPAVWGMRKGLVLTTLRVPQAVVCAVLVITMTTLNATSREGALIFGWMFPSAAGAVVRRGSWYLRLVPFVIVWPAAYIVARASWRRWPRKPPRIDRDPVFKEGNVI